MKNSFFAIVLIFGTTLSFAQLNPLVSKKICVEGDVAKMMYIQYSSDIIIAKADYPNRLFGIDAKTGQQIWVKNYHIGFGIHRYGNDIIVSKNANTYNDKTSTTTTHEWLYTLNPATGELKDSLFLNYSIVYLSSSKGLTENIALINQGNDVKMKAVIANKKTGAVAFTLFTEVKENGYDVVPNAIQIDPTEKYVAVGTANGSKGFYLFDFKTGKQVLNLPGKGDIQNIVFSSDGTYCFYVQNKFLKIINVTTLKLEKEIALESDVVFTAIHNDNENLAITGFGTTTTIKFVNWKTGKIFTSDITSNGGPAVFTNEGALFVPFQKGIQCFVEKDKLPYLAMITFGTLPISVTSVSTTNTTNTIANFNVGSRAYIYYAGDGKYYSGVITELTADGFKAIYDDGSIGTVKKAQVKTLPALKVGDKIQVRRADNKFYNCTIKSIVGDAVQVEYSTGIEWVSLRSVMQVE